MHAPARVVALTVVVCLLAIISFAAVPGTITVQGRLTDATGTPPVAGSKLFVFRIFDMQAGGAVQWPGPTGETQSVNTDEDGLWTAQLGLITPLTPDVFSDSSRWLEVTVYIGIDPPVTLPRTRLRSGAYSFRAAVADSALVIAGDGTYLPLNGGTMTGSIDNTGDPPITMGKGNFGSGNTNSGLYSFVAGRQNEASGDSSTVGGGAANTASGGQSTIAGGTYNTATAQSTTVAGGYGNDATGWTGTISGGYGNTASGNGSTVGGGVGNTASETRTTVAGGHYNTAEGEYAVVGGGQANHAATNITTVAGGWADSALNSISTVSGGSHNVATGSESTVGGGTHNRCGGGQSTIGGGGYNETRSHIGTIPGGAHNVIQSQGIAASIGGGENNSANGDHSVIGGGEADTIINTGDYAVIAGGERNTMWGAHAVIGGGAHHLVQGDYAAVLGGYADTINGYADYSYLFGIGSKLTEDSTFMVDMPHIVFGDETNGYEFPVERGTDGQLMSTDASGKLSWTDPAVSEPSGWTDAGSIVRLTTSTDNVGIGTSSPGAKLEVSGNTVITDSESQTALEVINSYAGGVSRMVNFERTDSVPTNNDVLQIKVASNSADNFQFIECERGDVKFKVEGDGNAYADGAFTGGGADFAEMIKASMGAQSLEAGDVLVIDPSNPRSVMTTTTPRSTLAAGIYSTKPGFVGSERDWDKAVADTDESGTYTRPEMKEMFGEIPLAVVGIVPCKVSAENGAINPGDLLVTSSTPGHAMRDEKPGVGTVIGKSLESLASGSGVIRVLVTLQ